MSTNNDMTMISVPVASDEAAFINEAKKLYRDYIQKEEVANRTVREVLPKIFASKPTEKYLAISQLARGICFAQENFLASDTELQEMEDRIKSAVKGDDKFARLAYGRKAGLHAKDRYTAEEWNEIVEKANKPDETVEA